MSGDSVTAASRLLKEAQQLAYDLRLATGGRLTIRPHELGAGNITRIQGERTITWDHARALAKEAK